MTAKSDICTSRKLEKKNINTEFTSIQNKILQVTEISFKIGRQTILNKVMG